MKRKIIEIDEAKCNGCGACAAACHEGAIGMVNGKAKLLRDDFCDGFGDCLPQCPTGAITFVEREAAAYDEKAVAAAKQAQQVTPPAGGCPGLRMQSLKRVQTAEIANASPSSDETPSQLAQWPCQIRLVPPNSPFFNGAELLIAADCTAYAYANFHQVFMRGRVTIVGCPKLDPVDYSEKLTEILRYNDIRSVTLVRMEVPCCGGLEHAAQLALRASGKRIPWQVVTISRTGQILE
jgi:Pyruvate/2-oxoacid:ferredoxin oxidoreductase delta subunit